MTKLVGLQKNQKEKETDYYNLSDIQKLFYDAAEQEFEEIKLKISKATKKSDLSKIRDRTIIKQRLAQKVSEKLGKKINHSHASQQNCPFLFYRINRWNKRLKAQYSTSDFSPEKFKTKAEIKKDLNQTKKRLNRQQTEIDITELEFMANALLLPVQSELKYTISKLENENRKLNEKIANLESQREQYLKQIANELDIQNIKQENIRLRTLLSKQGVSF